jgi:hypothetical protein
LRPGEIRNLFVTFEATPSMLRDTSAMVHMLGVFVPTDPAVEPDSVVLTMEIVNSHDPNTLAVSDTRINYRKVNQRELDYRVRFQNNGERQAETVEVTIAVPGGLNAAGMQPLDWYPACPICPPDGTLPGGCLDTAVTDQGIVFTFRNIYLPGSKQRGVSAYDSTKGYVRYRILPEKNMPKRSFSSRASIVFDQNTPVVTRRSTTRFKPGFSPGLKIGYGFDPEAVEEGYVFAGVSFSPYRSWRWHPQAELLTGFYGRTELPSDTAVTVKHGGFTSMGVLPDTVTQTISGGTRSTYAFEVPVLLRKNVTGWLGIGVGASARLVWEKGENTFSERSRQEFYEPGSIIPYKVVPLGQTTSSEPFSQTTFMPALFADVTLGRVRSGPMLGLRAGKLFDENAGFFFQVCLEYKW